MGIRNTAKAMIIRGESILLNRCRDENNGEYYSLPGGGQNQYETMNQALIRECLEETGNKVKIVRFAALCEEICMDEDFREKYPDYAHKMYHVFMCEIEQENCMEPTEVDDMQVGSEWVGLEQLKSIRLLPALIGNNITNLLETDVPRFLGSEHIGKNHG